MSREKPVDKNTAKKTIKIFWQATLEQKKYNLPLLLTIPAAQFLQNFATTWIMSGVINTLSTETIAPDQVFAKFGWQLALYALSIAFGELVFWRLSLWLNWKADENAAQKLRERAFDALAVQSMSFHNNKFGGSLVSQMSRFSNAYISLVDTVIWNILPMIISFGLTFAILGPQLPLFTLLLAVFSAGFMTIAYFSFAKIRHFSEREAAAQSKLTAQLSDSVSNIQTVKSFGREKYEIRRFSRKNKAQRDASLGTMKAMIVRDVRFGTILSSLSIATFIFLIGGHAWFGASLGALFMAVSYMNNIWVQLWQFNRILRNINKGFGDSQEMTEILEAKVSVKDAPNAKKIAVRGGEIDFRDITFWHADAKKKDAIFRDLTLTIPAGQKVGLVGRSGSGKTTLTKLLLRFSDVQKGEIVVDSQNIREITQKSLHRAIAYVPQEPMLFHRTIRENIIYSKPRATEEEIREAAKKANALEFIEKLDDGFETMAGERGVKLSGGQRQRIAIARAILADAPILVLDEATSALDTESERLIQDALKNLMAGRTSIVIAHRLSTVANLDRIIVMDGGKIKEDGSHKDLISRKNSIYAKLWNQQTGALSENDADD